MDKKKNFEGFFLQISQDFFRRNDLTLEEKSLYCILLTFANNKEKKAFPKIDTLKRMSGLKTHNSIIKILRSLETKGLIDIRKSERKKSGEYANNVYFLKVLPMSFYHSDNLTSNYINNNNESINEFKFKGNIYEQQTSL